MATSSIQSKRTRPPLSLEVTRRALLARLPVLFILAAVALGALHTWAAAHQYSMNEDGIAYLDIGDAFWRGDWATAINPVWSPLYSWLLGLVMRVIQPPMRWEFPLVHLVNFGVYLCTLACFQVFWRHAGQFRLAHRLAGAGEASWQNLPEWAWWSLGYALFIWTALGLIEVWAVTPDMLMAALAYLSSTLLIKIRMGQNSWRIYLLLGLILGLGYLTKAIMFPLAFIFLAVSWLSAGSPRRAFPRMATATIVFGLIAGAYVAVLFRATGRLTISDAGRLTYVRYVNGLPYPHWQGGDPSLGVPEHPSRQILALPPVYEFGTPVGGTYPIGHDPSYWYAGATPRFDLGGQAQALISSAQFYIDLFFRQQAGLVLAALVWYGLAGRTGVASRNLLAQWGLAICALAAFTLYAVVYVEGRYVGVFITLLWADLLANARWPAQPTLSKVSSWLSAGALALLLINILAFNLAGVSAFVGPRHASHPAASAARPPSWPGEVAEELQRLDIGPGDRVGVIGYAFDSFWARLARVQIVAEMLGAEAGPFWMGNTALQARVIAAFRQTGVRAILAEDVPSYAVLPGWQQLGQTDYYAYVMAP